MNSRWQDTPLAVLLRLLADLMIANMLGLICSFGVVTAGAGLSAMYAVLFQRERDGGTVSAVKTFFHAFRKNFWQATLLEVIVAFAAAVAVVDFRFALGMEGALRNVYLLVGTVITAIALESLHEAIEALERNGFAVEISCVNVSRAKKVARYHMMTAQNPVYLIGGNL